MAVREMRTSLIHRVLRKQFTRVSRSISRTSVTLGVEGVEYDFMSSQVSAYRQLIVVVVVSVVSSLVD